MGNLSSLSFPLVAATNPCSIVTQRLELNGIVATPFYEPRGDDTFSIGCKTSLSPKWLLSEHMSDLHWILSYRGHLGSANGRCVHVETSELGEFIFPDVCACATFTMNSLGTFSQGLLIICVTRSLHLRILGCHKNRKREKGSGIRVESTKEMENSRKRGTPLQAVASLTLRAINYFYDRAENLLSHLF